MKEAYLYKKLNIWRNKISKTCEALQKAEKEKMPHITKRPNKEDKKSLTNFEKVHYISVKFIIT